MIVDTLQDISLFLLGALSCGFFCAIYDSLTLDKRIIKCRIQKLSLRKGDVLVLKSQHPLDEQQVGYIKDRLKKILPEGIDTIITSKDLDIAAVLSHEDDRG
ncbi:hypothetical protein SAMN06296273_1181 [Nitrosomonas ureae]|uniref:Uncharacterized protein n=1 Tax=Nitrosomonas ureae TaxID=44577 RepID=A0A285BXV3_9PROT|nr:hypothetical protein [Nitrosomonas ureae]SNX59746.1 hypothetical protein SAMN06296273_1181 [Nitrosomonas ureae]